MLAGNASDQTLIRQVKDDKRDWTLAKIVWVTERGLASEANRRNLCSGNHAYIIGEPLRSSSPEVKTALSRQGRVMISQSSSARSRWTRTRSCT